VVSAGLARARDEGKQLGRPRLAEDLEHRIKKALATPGRPGVRKIAEQFGVGGSTVQRISAEARPALSPAQTPRPPSCEA
jgi:DNA invertase Pin-like site-specific DNA recombinase